MPDFYETIESAPDYAKATADLASWSGNYDHPTPFTLFCDLIGFSGEEFGTVGFFPQAVERKQEDIDPDSFKVSAWVSAPLDWERAHANLIDQRLGFLELGKLAAALSEYADRPQDVTEFVRKLNTPEDDESA